MKEILIVLTETYPYLHGESFIENEEEFWKFDKILLIPTNKIYGQPRTYKNPAIEVINIWDGKNFIFSGLLQSLGDFDYWNEVRRIVNHFSIRKLLFLTKFIFESHQKVKEILKRLDKYNFSSQDQVTLYSYWAFEAAYIGQVLKKKLEVRKFITRIHGYDLYEQRNKYNYLPMRDTIFSTCDYILPVSEAGKKYLELKWKKYQNKYLVSHLGTKDHGVQLLEETKEFHILTCSNIISVKRLDKLVDALALVKNYPIKWTHFGDGNLADTIKEKAHEKLGENIAVEFKGKCKNSEVIENYKNSVYHCFVNTSDSEGLPVSIMEAISFGIPVIAPDVGGMKEIVCDQTGILLNKGFHIQELADAINNMASIYKEDTNRYQELRNNARKFWEQNYDAVVQYSNFNTFLHMKGNDK